MAQHLAGRPAQTDVAVRVGQGWQMACFPRALGPGVAAYPARRTPRAPVPAIGPTRAPTPRRGSFGAYRPLIPTDVGRRPVHPRVGPPWPMLEPFRLRRLKVRPRSRTTLAGPHPWSLLDYAYWGASMCSRHRSEGVLTPPSVVRKQHRNFQNGLRTLARRPLDPDPRAAGTTPITRTPAKDTWV